MPQDIPNPSATRHSQVEPLSAPPTGKSRDGAQPAVLVITAPPRPGKMSWSIAPL